MLIMIIDIFTLLPFISFFVSFLFLCLYFLFYLFETFQSYLYTFYLSPYCFEFMNFVPLVVIHEISTLYLSLKKSKLNNLDFYLKENKMLRQFSFSPSSNHIPSLSNFFSSNFLLFVISKWTFCWNLQLIFAMLCYLFTISPCIRNHLLGIIFSTF